MDAREIAEGLSARQMSALAARDAGLACEMLPPRERHDLIAKDLAVRSWQYIPREYWRCPPTRLGREVASLLSVPGEKVG